MTKTEQVEVVREKINFEKEFLDYQIKLVKEAEKELENCSYEDIQEKRSILGMRRTAASSQYMCLCGVLELSYELDLISKDEYNNVREQAFNKTFR